MKTIKKNERNKTKTENNDLHILSNLYSTECTTKTTHILTFKLMNIVQIWNSIPATRSNRVGTRVCSFNSMMKSSGKKVNYGRPLDHIPAP